MGDRLDIGHLHARIRGADAARAQQLASRVLALGGRELPRALAGSAAHALACAGLPAEAVVAVRRLELHLRVGENVQATELAAGWAAAVEAALVRLLRGRAPGDGDVHAAAIWFADAWAVERRHLERRATGAPDAWWTASLLMDDPADAAGGGGDGDDPLAILYRWLRRSPARAVIEMAAAVRAEPHLARLLEPAQAQQLAHLLVARVSDRRAHDDAGATEISARLEAAFASAAQGDFPAPAADRPLDDLRACLCTHRERLAAWAAAPRCEPWLAALLLAEHPSASRVGAARLLDLLHAVRDAPTADAGTTPAATATPRARTSPDASVTVADSTPARAHAATARAPTAATDTAAHPTDAAVHAEHRVHAGGLLLLLRPLAYLGLLEGCAAPGRALGDVALLALQRVFAPLAPGARMAALERERPLLAVFAPECDWRARIADTPMGDPQIAADLLERLAAAIPAEIAFAPGAGREIFGMQSAAYPTATEHRLAALLLRPGLLRVNGWEAEIEWPLAAIDLALRRTGWDQDPGWVPWIGRTIRLRFGAGR